MFSRWIMIKLQTKCKTSTYYRTLLDFLTMRSKNKIRSRLGTYFSSITCQDLSLWLYLPPKLMRIFLPFHHLLSASPPFISLFLYTNALIWDKFWLSTLVSWCSPNAMRPRYRPIPNRAGALRVSHIDELGFCVLTVDVFFVCGVVECGGFVEKFRLTGNLGG